MKMSYLTCIAHGACTAHLLPVKSRGGTINCQHQFVLAAGCDIKNYNLFVLTHSFSYVVCWHISLGYVKFRSRWPLNTPSKASC